MDEDKIICLALFSSISLLVEGRTTCMTTDDCANLGSSAICVKSACEVGTCACQRGYALRFLGNYYKFRCVPMKKIGEKCSLDEPEGVCAAANARCINERCTCETNYESRFGGETCISTNSPYDVEVSESYSLGLGSICLTGSLLSDNAYRASRQYTGGPLSSLINFPLDKTPPQCGCPIGSHTELSNEYHQSSFIGNLYPICVANSVGDICITDDDCGSIQRADGMGGWTGTDAAQCVDKKCQCANSTYTSDITGLFCAPALAHGAQCMISGVAVTSNIGVCDGTLGLRCGSPCDTPTLYGSRNFTCACDPAYSESGTTCTERAVGAECNGDMNCRRIGETAYCDADGKCAADSGVGFVAASISCMFLPIVYAVFFNKL